MIVPMVQLQPAISNAFVQHFTQCNAAVEYTHRVIYSPLQVHSQTHLAKQDSKQSRKTCARHDSLASCSSSRFDRSAALFNGDSLASRPCKPSPLTDRGSKLASPCLAWPGPPASACTQSPVKRALLIARAQMGMQWRAQHCRRQANSGAPATPAAAQAPKRDCVERRKVWKHTGGLALQHGRLATTGAASRVL